MMTLTTCPTPQSAETDRLSCVLAAVNQKHQRATGPEKASLAARVRGLMAELESARADLAAGRAVQLFPAA